MDSTMEGAPLGAASDYPEQYDPGLLFAIPRAQSRASLDLPETLPFRGQDVWNAYEVSWLSPTGVPLVRVGTFVCDALSPNLIESKSLKLYLNSLNNTRFDSDAEATKTIAQDLGHVSGADVRVELRDVPTLAQDKIEAPPGWCIDDPTTTADLYEVSPELLRDSTVDNLVCATVYSDLLRSCCPVTGQPDWATLVIRYCGGWIDHQALLRYVISFRNHADFHEHCVERIFVDIKRHCAPELLTVFARYTRRGGLDINPFRSDFESPGPNSRLVRQ